MSRLGSALIFFILAAIGVSTSLLVTRPLMPHTGWRIQPAGEMQKAGDHLAGGEISPDRKWIAFAAVGQGIHKLHLVDANTGKLTGTVDLQRGWIGMSWSNPETLIVSGGTANSIHEVKVNAQGVPSLAKSTPVGDLAQTRNWLAGLVVNGDHAYVAANATDRLLKVNLATGAIEGELKFAENSAPYQVRATRDGRFLVSLQATAEVVAVDPATLQVTETWQTGRHPNDILVHGDRAFVACGNDDVVMAIDLYNNGIEERIMTRPWPHAPAGSTPHALAISPNGKMLFVANSDNNAVARIDVSKRGHSVVEGFIPSGRYPSAVAVLNDGKRVVIGAGKGMLTGPNDKTDQIHPEGPAGYPYIVTLLEGLLTTVDFTEDKQNAEMTRRVLALSPYRDGIAQKPAQAPKRGSNPVPSFLGDPSPIQHVLYIIKENRTYDQLFGDLTKNGKPYGNGEPKLTLFGEDVSPNHRELARQYVLLDNLYASGDVSVDGHHWTNGAYVPDFMQRTWPQQYSGKGAPRLVPKLAETPNGRIWDQCRREGLSYKTYYYHTRDRMNDEWAKARAERVRDWKAVDVFIRDFQEMEAKGTVPRFMVMALSEDHTSGLRAGAFTPKACVASNDLGLGKIVETISKSKLWGKFAIFVIEDDAQNGPDHVDAHRTIGLVISPYTYGKGIDSTHYTTVSMIRTMSLILGLPPMSQHDAAATPMYRSFATKPNLVAYQARTPKQNLDVKNPERGEPPALQAIDFSEPDQLTLAQEIALNKAIWHDVKGKSVPYPGAVRRFGFNDPQEED